MHTNPLINSRSFASLLQIFTFVLFAFPAFSQSSGNRSAVADWLESYRLSGDFTPVNLFSPNTERSDDLENVVANASLLDINDQALDELLHVAPATLRLQIPYKDNAPMELELVKVNILAPEFTVGTLGDNAADNIPYHPAAHYRGIWRDHPNSVVAISFTSTGVMGMIAADDDKWELGKMEDGSDRHILYRNADLNASVPFECSSDDDAVLPDQEISSEERGVGCKTVNVYFECDYKLYTDKGSSATNVTNYVTGMFNQVAALYANENVGIAISQIYVWTSTDPYAGYGSTSSVLNAFRNQRGTNHNGNLAHFLSTRPLGGGIAYLDVICFKNYAHGVSAIGTSYQNVPTYSWTVEVVTHELGHNLGSWHTHSCNWTGGAIDNCYSPEGSCPPGPAPQGGGTIMSYCHLSSVGINFTRGFGTLPGNRIRTQVTNASCLAQSGTIPTGLTVGAITNASASLSWGAITGATSYIIQYKTNSSTTWTTLNSVTTTSYNLTGLAANTTYNWKVKTDCSNYSVTSNFTTTNTSGGGGGGSTTCAAPSGLTNSGVTTNSITVQWTPVSGASSYTVQYKLSSSSTWTTAGSPSTNSYNLTGLNPGTMYNWRVKSNCSTGYSSVAAFTTSSNSGGGSGGGGGSACNAPTNLANSNITATTARISWSSVPGASNYTLQIKIGSGAFFTLGTVPVTSVTISGLSPSTTYQWKVKASCSVYSTPKTLVTASYIVQPNGPAEAAQIAVSYEDNSLKLAPNPTTAQLMLTFNGEINAASELVITDPSGRIVRRLNLTQEQTMLDVADFPAGIYFANIVNGEKRMAVERFVKI